MRFNDITKRLAHLGSDRWRIHFDALSYQDQWDDLILLTIGEPDIAAQQDILDICKKAIDNGRYGYSNGRGESAMIDALVKKYQKTCGHHINHNYFLCLPGTQTGLFLSMLGLTKSGDEVILSDPSYATYESCIYASGAKPVYVTCDKEHNFIMQANDIIDGITENSRAILLNNPHNPTGAVYKHHDVHAIADICRQYQLWLICDEVYADMIYDNHTFVSPFEDRNNQNFTIILSSLSKSFAIPGFRSGWLLASPTVTEKLLPISEAMLFGSQPFIADMAAYALCHDNVTANKMRQDYQSRAQIAANILQSSYHYITPMMPKSGMFMLLDISNCPKNDMEFCLDLLHQQHVALMPGSAFGNNSQHYVRLSLTNPTENIIAACHRLNDYITIFDG